jgi:hypothetical protein
MKNNSFLHPQVFLNQFSKSYFVLSRYRKDRSTHTQKPIYSRLVGREERFPLGENEEGPSSK